MADKEAVPVEGADIDVNIWTMPAVFVLETRMPDGMVEDLNTYLDDLREQADKESLAHSLVGQIAHGEQLNMDPEHEKVRQYSKFVTLLGAQYINHFMKSTGQSLPKNRQVAIDETWSVHSYAGDYNPIHDHGTKRLWVYQRLVGLKYHNKYWISLLLEVLCITNTKRLVLVMGI